MMLLGIDDEHAAFSSVADPGLIPTSAAPIKDASSRGGGAGAGLVECPQMI